MIIIHSQDVGYKYWLTFLMFDWIFSLLLSFQICTDENMLLVLGPLPKEARNNINESWYSALVSCFGFRNSCVSFYGLICFKHRIFWMCWSLSLFHWMFWDMPLLMGRHQELGQKYWRKVRRGCCHCQGSRIYDFCWWSEEWAISKPLRSRARRCGWWEEMREIIFLQTMRRLGVF